MTPQKTKYPRAEALPVARELVRALEPVTSRLIVAGSLRRRKATVGDVEILYIGRTELRRDGLFDEAPFDLAEEVIAGLLDTGLLAKRLDDTGRPLGWGSKNKLALHGPSGFPVDLFAATEENWWSYLVCRTGPGESNIRLAAEARNKGYKWNPYGAGFTHLATGRVVPVTSEAHAFEFVGLEYREPWER